MRLREGALLTLHIAAASCHRSLILARASVSLAEEYDALMLAYAVGGAARVTTEERVEARRWSAIESLQISPSIWDQSFTCLGLLEIGMHEHCHRKFTHARYEPARECHRSIDRSAQNSAILQPLLKLWEDDRPPTRASGERLLADEMHGSRVRRSRRIMRDENDTLQLSLMDRIYFSSAYPV